MSIISNPAILVVVLLASSKKSRKIGEPSLQTAEYRDPTTT